MKIDLNIQTDGSGYWSTVKKTVHCTRLEVEYVSDEEDFGELCVYFDDTWNEETDGLIYTDGHWIKDLRCQLVDKYGFTCEAVDGRQFDYSEQGMQGDNYVSLDVGKAFLDEWKKH